MDRTPVENLKAAAELDPKRADLDKAVRSLLPNLEG